MEIGVLDKAVKSFWEYGLFSCNFETDMKIFLNQMVVYLQSGKK